MNVILRKCYNKEKKEITKDYKPKFVPELIEQLTEIYNKSINNSVT